MLLCTFYVHRSLKHLSKNNTVNNNLFLAIGLCRPIPVAVRSKAWVFGRSLTRIMGSNPTGGMDVCLL
jgi:hypothetical protein